MNEEEYHRVAAACDKLLRRPDATLEWIAIPWLHVLNGHPVNVAKYQRLVEDLRSSGERLGSLRPFAKMSRRGRASAHRVALLVRNVLRAAAYATWRKVTVGASGAKSHGSPNPHKVDVIIVSWLVNIDHLQRMDDFYFGNLQSILADHGLSSLLVLHNQTGHPTSDLFEQARRDGPCSRLILSNVVTPLEELGFIRRCVRARRHLRQTEQEATTLLDRQVARKARNLIVSNEVVSNLRLHAQIANLCHQMRPSVVMTLYEGHAWERCVWHAARTSPVPALCVGYQHTTLWKHAYAVKRSLGADKRCDPDLILTVGDVTRRILQASQDLRGTRIMAFGTHRRASGGLADAPRSVPCFLVLPEGIESECVYLFEFALRCAQRLPNVRFIFRTHPVLPFEKIESKLRGYHPVRDNVQVSRNKSIEDDFARGGYLLYRGSSTVIYAVLAGLRPFYVARLDEMDIDPLYTLSDWRERVSSVEELLARYLSHQTQGGDDSIGEWRRARAFCDEYVQPVREDAIAEILRIAGQASPQDANSAL